MKEGEPELGGLQVPHKDTTLSTPTPDARLAVSVAQQTPSATQAPATAQPATQLIPQTFAPNDTAGGGVQLNNLASQSPTPRPTPAFQQPQPSQFQQSQQFSTQPPAPSAANNIVFSNDSSSRKKPIFKIFVIILIAIFVISGIATLLIFTNTGHQNFKQKVEDLYSALDWVPYIGQCSMVVDNYNSTFTSVEDFTEYVNDCRQNAETVQTLLSDLKNKNNSAEYINLYNALSSAVSDTLVFGENLDYSLNLYTIWHNWLSNIENIDIYQTEVEIDELVSPLILSSNEELAEYGAGWAELRKDVVAAYILAETYNYEPEYLDAYFAVDNALTLYENNNNLDIKSLVSLNDDVDLTALFSALNNFYNYGIGETL